MKKQYGNFYMVNLMSDNKSGEKELSASFNEMNKMLNYPGANYKHMDFHAITEGTNFSSINPYAESMNRYLQEQSYNMYSVSPNRMNETISFVNILLDLNKA